MIDTTFRPSRFVERVRNVIPLSKYHGISAKFRTKLTIVLSVTETVYNELYSVVGE